MTPLSDYYDQQLLNLRQFGFPLDFDRSTILGVTENNHTSALNFSIHIDNYISEELILVLC